MLGLRVERLGGRLMRPVPGGLAALVLALLLAPTGALAQKDPYFDYWYRGNSWEFPIPFQGPGWYLVRCFKIACPADGLYLVPDPATVGFATRTLGGPYRQRLDMEMDRNTLVPRGVLPEYPVRVTMVDGAGRPFSGFWLGARPLCRYSAPIDGPLSGSVSADLSPPSSISRPPAFPVPFDSGALVAAFEEIMPVCKERQQRTRATGQVFGAPPNITSGPLPPRMPGDPPRR